ncbi:MAG: PAS domain-containing protein, partial [Spirochaetaceae bacterium]|nr:PAS domain-containing protein [Spirochaetaceae bacterium]
MRIRTKLFTIYLLAGILPLFIIGVYYNARLKEENLQSLYEFFSAQLIQIDFALSSFLKEVAYDVENFSSNTIVQTKEDSNFTNFLEADENNFTYNIGATEQQIIELFANYRKTRPYANSVYMGRENGSFVRSHPRARPTRYDPRERPWYKLGISTPGQVMRTIPYQSVTTSDINIGIVKALVDDNGKAFGVIGVDITLRNLTHFISQIKAGKSSSIFIVDDRGIILSSPEKDMQFKHYEEIGLKGFKEVMDKEKGYLFFDNNGIKNVVFFYTSPFLGWKICAVATAGTIEKEINQFTNTVISLLGLVFLTMILNNIYLSKRIFGTIKTLQKKIGELNTDLREKKIFKKILIKGKDEISDLAFVFNNMGEELFDIHHKLEEQSKNLENIVARRTEDLIIERNIFIKGEAVVFRWKNREGLPIEYVSPNVKDVFGYTAGELNRGEFLYTNIINPEYLEQVIDELRSAVESKVTDFKHRDYQIICKNGSSVWLHQYTTFKRNLRDEVTHYLGYVIDVTERRKAEEALHIAHNDLIIKAADLELAKEAAETASKAKSAFLSNMSHEIRTPMNAVIGFTDLLFLEEEDPEKKNKLEMIKTSGKNLLSLINDILDFSKIEAGKIDIENRSFNLGATLDHLHSMYKRKAEDKGLDFNIY